MRWSNRRNLVRMKVLLSTASHSFFACQNAAWSWRAGGKKRKTTRDWCQEVKREWFVTQQVGDSPHGILREGHRGLGSKSWADREDRDEISSERGQETELSCVKEGDSDSEEHERKSYVLSDLEEFFTQVFLFFQKWAVFLGLMNEKKCCYSPHSYIKLVLLSCWYVASSTREILLVKSSNHLADALWAVNTCRQDIGYWCRI